MAQITGLDYKIKEMAGRIRELREIEGYTTYEMAAKTDVTNEEYVLCESGNSDLNFAFIYRCALALNVDVTDIIEGHSPTLKSFTVTRAGAGQEIANAHGMTYYNLAYAFQNRIAEPLYVKSAFNADAEKKDIELTTHDGQELDIVIDGHLLVQVGEHRTTLGPGDSIYFDSSTPHGMIAVSGEDCNFYAIVLNPTGEPIPELSHTAAAEEIKPEVKKDTKERIYQKFIDVVENDNGTPLSIKFKNEDKFNFAFDIIDALAEKEPDKLAMIHIDKHKNEKRFTFRDLKRASNQCANYFKSLGIKKGDKVMLVLKRHYQYWFAMLGLNKLGAIAIPATNQLQAHDFEYRFNVGQISTVICTSDGDTANQVDIACGNTEWVRNKIIVGDAREGWHDFNEEYTLFSSHYARGALRGRSDADVLYVGYVRISQACGT